MFCDMLWIQLDLFEGVDLPGYPFEDAGQWLEPLVECRHVRCRWSGGRIMQAIYDLGDKVKRLKVYSNRISPNEHVRKRGLTVPDCSRNAYQDHAFSIAKQKQLLTEELFLLKAKC